MTKYKLEYIWLDGYTPVPNLRGKTQIKEFPSFPTLEQLPLWGFDGSSTMQAEGHSSDCVLKPVAIYPDAARKDGALVMCEVMMPDGKTPHSTNKRATILDDPGAWFGFEQEYRCARWSASASSASRWAMRTSSITIGSDMIPSWAC
jgi:glutamine synthetase